MKKFILVSTLTAATLFSALTYAADYNIDREGTHASIIFKVKHLGYSWLTGRFNDFDGKFSYDQNIAEASQVNVVIQTASLDSNHAERDKHLKGEDFLDVSKYSTSTFASTKYVAIDENSGTLTGEFSLHGVTNMISFPIEKIGEGTDPWGGYRAGFSGKTTLKLADYGIDYNLGPASTHVELELFIEGIRE